MKKLLMVAVSAFALSFAGNVYANGLDIDADLLSGNKNDDNKGSVVGNDNDDNDVNSNNKDEATRYYCRVLSVCPKGEDAEIARKGLEILGTGCGAK